MIRSIARRACGVRYSKAGIWRSAYPLTPIFMALCALVVAACENVAIPTRAAAPATAAAPQPQPGQHPSPHPQGNQQAQTGQPPETPVLQPQDSGSLPEETQEPVARPPQFPFSGVGLSLPDGEVGRAFNDTGYVMPAATSAGVADGIVEYSVKWWSANPGLAFDPATRLVSGFPTKVTKRNQYIGNYKATNSQGLSVEFPIHATIVEGTGPVGDPPGFSLWSVEYEGSEGDTFSVTLPATDTGAQPVKYYDGSGGGFAHHGLSLDGATRVLSGTLTGDTRGSIHIGSLVAEDAWGRKGWLPVVMQIGSAPRLIPGQSLVAGIIGIDEIGEGVVNGSMETRRVSFTWSSTSMAIGDMRARDVPRSFHVARSVALSSRLQPHCDAEIGELAVLPPTPIVAGSQWYRGSISLSCPAYWGTWIPTNLSHSDFTVAATVTRGNPPQASRQSLLAVR